MPSNVEIKAVLRDRKRAEEWANQRAGSSPELIHQEDVFFPCQGARLKLRILAPNHGELIRYRRSNSAKVRMSQYEIVRTETPEALREILTKTLGTLGVVKKTRLLYRIGQTRLHIDNVDGLGDFLELEVELRPDQTEEEGKSIAEDFLKELNIPKADLLANAYLDMLHARSAP